MRLKALTLQGFKTFVRRTQLDFEPGLTAIVGPNGSGKSNLADALRWVLGEQSLRNLRSRRVEDVIFTGGPGRPPAGMAEVGLTFDNSRRWLDLPYNEVAIARRAYRSGENEYYLNRERSRLRNITDLLGQIGLSTDSFAIVGQGAIDAALSLRTEDRRGLIEQAALISHLDARLEDAQRRLQDTQQNINRLNDLISELTPHLRTLERQARQAREFTSMRDEFRQGLISWYAHRWSIPDQQRCQADSDRRSADASARIAAEEAARLGPLLQDIHERLSVCQNDVQITTERVKALANERVNLCQARDLLVERRQSTNQRLSDFRQAIDGNQRDLERERAELASLAGEQSTLSNQLTEIEADIKQKEAEAASWVQQHHTLTESIADTQEAINRARGEHVSALAQQRITVERVEQLSRAIAEQTEREAKLHEELAVIKARAEAAQQELSSARAQLDQFRTEHSQLVDQRDQIQRRLSQLATELAAGDREYQALQARHDALESADEAGVGFYSGVRAVLRAANGHGQVHLDGIFGVVAKLIEAPTEAELAIETALGGHLQDIVVARWEDAEAAIAHLKSSGAGRATFLPLNTIRPNRRPPPPSRPGVLGVASELVTIAPRFRTIGDYLLGQTLVVESLSVARQLLHECPASWQIVTLDGDVARPTGVVTGGSPGANRGTLARYRELRQIRGQLAERAREREKQAASLAEVQTTATRIEGQLADLGRAMRGAEERLRRASTMVSETRRQENQCARDLAWQREELKRLEGQLETAERERSTAAMTAAVAAERVVQTSQAYENTRALLQALERETSVSTNTLGALRNQADRLRDRIAALIGEQKNVTKRIQNLELSLAERQDRLTELQQQATDLET
ncbi:MAG TPA: chromosome segregation protein SMC, partial [Chloroflexota bacterium]|nr:chromosome segregation protein SMC [Chloroflexota bacterium]